MPLGPKIGTDFRFQRGDSAGDGRRKQRTKSGNLRDRRRPWRARRSRGRGHHGRVGRASRKGPHGRAKPPRRRGAGAGAAGSGRACQRPARRGVFRRKNVRSGVDFAAVNAHVRRAVEAIAPQVRRNVQGPRRARHCGRGTIEGFRHGDGRRGHRGGSAPFHHRDRSTPIIPPIPGLADTPVSDARNRGRSCRLPASPSDPRRWTSRPRTRAERRRLGSRSRFLKWRGLKHEDRQSAAIVHAALGDEAVRLRNGVRFPGQARAGADTSRYAGRQAGRWRLCRRRGGGRIAHSARSGTTAKHRPMSIVMRPASATIRNGSSSTTTSHHRRKCLCDR